MSYRMKITLPDPTMTQLEALAEQRGEPVSRIAAQMVCAGIAEVKDPRRDDSSISASSPATAPDRNAPWIEPVLGDLEWRSYMWGSIVALYGRYPRELAHLKDGWWEDAAHVEVLCALVVWRDWIDQAAEDPRHELAFHAQLSDYSRELRQEGGGVTRAWQPGAAPDGWARLIGGHDANERQHRGDARIGGRGRARTTGTQDGGSCRGQWPPLRAPEASASPPCPR